MPSIINATTSTGLVQTADNSGSLQLQTNNGTTAVTIDTSQNVGIGTSSPSALLDVNGNLAITGSARRITGDFSNATQANRVAFQTSTTNGNTNLALIPNGTGTGSQFWATGGSDIANSPYLGVVQVGTTDSRIQSGIQGTASYTPMTFYTGGSERLRIDTSGNVGIGTSSPTNKVHIQQTSAASSVTQLVLQNADNSTGTGSALGFANHTSAGLLTGKVEGAIDGANAYSMRFYTYQSGLNERMRLDASGNLLFNSGYGSVATAYGCRAWVNFNGTGTPAIRASGNVSSITDNGTGDYTVNFTNAMPDTNYCPTVGGDFSQGATRDNGIHIPSNFTFNTGSLRISTTNDTGAYTDIDTVLLAIFR